jgi:hypothetical protein
MQLDGHADFFRSFIWSRVFGPMQFCNGSDKGAALNFFHILEEVRILQTICSVFYAVSGVNGCMNKYFSIVSFRVTVSFS